jgi:hypothetical protein
MTFRVRPAAARDSAAVCDLFMRVFGREMTQAEWRWKYPNDPDGWAAVVAEESGRLIGHFGAWPFRALIAGREVTIHSLVDVATLPEARGLGGRRPVLMQMAETLFDILRPTGTPFGFGFPSPRHLEIGRRLIGYREHFPVREIQFELPAAHEPVPGAVSADSAPPAFEGLWEASRALLSAGALLRDRRRANWRYHARPDRYYRMVTLPGDAGGAGWVVLNVTGERALVMDYLVRPPAAASFPPLFDAAAVEAAALGARRLVFWEPPGGPFREPLEALRRQAGPRASVVDAGFSFVTAKIFDEAALHDFLRDLHFTAGFYDDR